MKRGKAEGAGAKAGCTPRFHERGYVEATNGARAEARLDMGRIEETPRTLQWQFDLCKELRKDAIPRPSAEILIDAVPTSLRSIDGTPLTALTENNENSPQHPLHWQGWPAALLCAPFLFPPVSVALR